MRAVVLFLLTLVAVPVAAAVPNETKDCVMLSRVQDQRIVDDRTILFRESGRWYRNELAQSCAGLNPRRALRSITPSARLCSGELVTVFDSFTKIEYGSCPLGKFTRVEAPAPASRNNRGR